MLTTQLSVTVGGVHVTFVPQVPVAAFALTVIVEGQPEMIGLVTSLTTTLNVHVDCLPEASVAVYVTGVVPTEKNDPGAFVLVMFTTQLSVTVGGVHVTLVPQVPMVSSALTVMFEGHPTITGSVTSVTTTLNVHVDCLPEASVAVYVTAVVPTEKNAPGALSLVMFTTQLSVTVGGVHDTFVPHVPIVASAFNVIVEGQFVITGFVTSLTITSNVQVDVLPEASVAVYVTGVVPTEKNCPGDLLLVKLARQLSVAVGGVQVTFVPQVPTVASAFTVMVEGHPVITGLELSTTVTVNEHVDVLP